jgi:hypothetical protein
MDAEKRYGRVRETSWTKVTAVGAVRAQCLKTIMGVESRAGI